MSPLASDGNQQITIVLADDHAVVRSALRSLLESRSECEVVGEAADIASTREKVRELRPRVLILDVNMPDGLGTDALPALREDSPETEIVFVSMQRDVNLARKAIESGARSYLFKDAAHTELITAVMEAAEGRSHVPTIVTSGRNGDQSDDESLLSQRESEVLRLIALGYANREIGEQLSLSIRTVETHRNHIQGKLVMRSRSELTRYALDHGLLEP